MLQHTALNNCNNDQTVLMILLSLLFFKPTPPLLGAPTGVTP